MNRWHTLDMARGLAVLLMIGFHVCYDLDQMFHVLDLNIKTDPFWTGLRSFILGTFILIAGMSLFLAAGKRQTLGTHLQKQKWLAVCAVLISLGTYPVFPNSWIYFGVLHFILLARILCYPCSRLFLFNLALGLGVLGVGLVVQNAFFNPKWINWIGLTTYKPFTEDYVPLFPWLGIFLIGIFAGRLLFASLGPAPTYNGPMSWIHQFIGYIGRRSLIIYMVHQPLLIGGMSLVYG